MPLPGVPQPRPGSALPFPAPSPLLTAGMTALKLPWGKPKGTTPKLGVKRGKAAADTSEGASEGGEVSSPGRTDGQTAAETCRFGTHGGYRNLKIYSTKYLCKLDIYHTA